MSLLPQIRTDLTLDPSPTIIDGQPTYLLLDPIKNKYYRISAKTIVILQKWRQITPQELLQDLNENSNIAFNEDDIKQTLEFLVKNQLLLANSPELVESIVSQAQQKHGHWIQKTIHHYLFFKIPLVKPDAFISKTLPYIRWMFSKEYLYFMATLLFIGVYLTLPKADEFFQAFDYFFSAEGAVYVFLGMSLVKTFHELGHAYVAKYYGTHVSTIGVAFLVLFPILYTDTSDAWRLKNPKHRLAIDCGGILSELNMMIWFLLFWHLVDNPILKNIFVYAISVGLVSSLFINLNPLMRFDGYYALSNFLNIENLQAHSFELARWKLRSWLIGLDEPMPYKVPDNKLKIMVTYAYLVWIYRFFIFIGIALLVYYMFFKILGIILFIVEIWYFILSPIVSELMVYFKHMRTLKFNRNIAITASILALSFIVLVFPWRATVVVPAVLTFEKKIDLYTNIDSYALSIPFHNRTAVSDRSLVFLARSPDLVYDHKLVEAKIRIIKTKILQQQGRAQQLGAKQTDRSELIALEKELENILEEQARLTLDAPMSGFIYNRAPSILPNRWYSANTYLFSIAIPGRWAVHAYVPEYMMSRIEYIREPVFLSNQADLEPIELKIIKKPLARVESLQAPYLASIFGGSVAVYQPTQNNPKLSLKESMFEFVFVPSRTYPDIQFEQRGVLIMKVARESFIKRIFQHVVAIIIRESSFS